MLNGYIQFQKNYSVISLLALFFILHNFKKYSPIHGWPVLIMHSSQHKHVLRLLRIHLLWKTLYFCACRNKYWFQYSLQYCFVVFPRKKQRRHTTDSPFRSRSNPHRLGRMPSLAVLGFRIPSNNGDHVSNELMAGWVRLTHTTAMF